MEVNENFSEKAPEDYELVKSALKGEQSAYSKIMSRYREAIYYLVLKMVKNETEAEELVVYSCCFRVLRSDRSTRASAHSPFYTEECELGYRIHFGSSTRALHICF